MPATSASQNTGKVIFQPVGVTQQHQDQKGQLGGHCLALGVGRCHARGVNPSVCNGLMQALAEALESRWPGQPLTLAALNRLCGWGESNP